MRHAILAATPALVLAASVPFAAWAEEPARLQLVIRDHRFDPPELRVPANRPVVIDVRNEDASAEEFESAELGVEKVIAAGRQSPVRIRPLTPGRYGFIGEYHADTAAGTIIAETGIAETGIAETGHAETGHTGADAPGAGAAAADTVKTGG